MDKYISADRLIRRLENRTYKAVPNFIKMVEEQEAADVIEAVRCKDCKHYQFADNRAFGMPVKMCEWFGFEDVDDDDFCSRAERITE